MKGIRSAGRPPYGLAFLLLLALTGLCLLSVPAQGERIENATANFAALDKVTALVKPLAINLDKTETFRTLKITPRVCYTRDPSEAPRTSTFVEIDEVLFDGTERRIFSGWMFAESPGLNPLVHPVFDVWLTGCSQPKRPVASRPGPAGTEASGQPALPPPIRRRPPR